jgi:hypothetical protein
VLAELPNSSTWLCARRQKAEALKYRIIEPSEYEIYHKEIFESEEKFVA